MGIFIFILVVITFYLAANVEPTEERKTYLKNKVKNKVRPKGSHAAETKAAIESLKLCRIRNQSSARKAKELAGEEDIWNTENKTTSSDWDTSPEPSPWDSAGTKSIRRVTLNNTEYNIPVTTHDNTCEIHGELFKIGHTYKRDGTIWRRLTTMGGEKVRMPAIEFRQYMDGY